MKQQEQQFERAYRRLNVLQKQAVDHIGLGPLLVIAGPGTGKTQILALRIANILKQTDARPDTILALTFTDAAAKNMRERLLKIIGKDAYYLQIHTFHSFCSQVINDFGEYFPLQRDSAALSDLERYQVFEELIDQFKPKNLRPLNDHYHYVRDIISSISNLKREGISVLEFEEILRAEEEKLIELKATTKAKTKINRAQKSFDKNKDLLLLYQEYQQKLAQNLRYDFDDMINFVVAAFEEHQELLLEYQENLQHFLVDEYQDTNSAQNKLIDLLASYWLKQGLEPDVFAVGDPNQSIFRFQGASVENVLAFTRTYQNATVITLDTAYRCPQNIYDSATALIGFNQLSKLDPKTEKINLVLDLKSSKGEGEKIAVSTAPSQTLESIYIVEEIRKLLAAGVPSEEIAVLYRNHRDVDELIEALNKWNIRYELAKGDDVLETTEIEQLLKLMALIDQVRLGAELEDLYSVMLYPFINLEELVVMKLGRVSGRLSGRNETVSIYDLWSRGLAFVNQNLVGQELSEAEWQTVSIFFEKIQQLIALDSRLTFAHWFEQLISQDGFGFLPYLERQNNKIELINNLNSFFKEIKALLNEDHQLNLTKFLAKIEIYRLHNLKIKVQDLKVRQAAVHLSTAHSAKGMEWDYVFLLNLVDKKWGNQRERAKIKLPSGILRNTDLSSKERNEDDRRLFYVALTRAKKKVYLSYPQALVSQTGSQDRVPSIFLTELAEIEAQQSKQLLERTDHSVIDQNAETYLAKLLTVEDVRQSGVNEREFFADLVKNFKLSTTALDSYLRDPAEFAKNTLLRLPRSKAVFMSFGTAVHESLERFYKYQQQHGQFPAQDFLLDNFQTALAKEILTSSDYQDRLKYGQEVLRAYYQHYSQRSVDVLDVERSFGYGRRKTLLGDIQLSGKIDRIDWLDKERGWIRVVDYKTGKAKTVGEIEASTKTAQQDFSERELALPASIRGSYQRQLVFYKLLIDLDPSLNPKLEVKEAVFNFVEPKEKGSDKFVERSFVISSEAVQDLKNLIKAVMAEIRELKFLES